jgi:hypothetical protein
MNTICDTEDFPTAWKASLLLMAFTGKGDMKYPSNYRGISLPSTLSKIYTGALAAKINY